MFPTYLCPRGSLWLCAERWVGFCAVWQSVLPRAHAGDPVCDSVCCMQVFLFLTLVLQSARGLERVTEFDLRRPLHVRQKEKLLPRWIAAKEQESEMKDGQR